MSSGSEPRPQIDDGHADIDLGLRVWRIRPLCRSHRSLQLISADW
jgi:hypothetical protein